MKTNHSWSSHETMLALGYGAQFGLGLFLPIMDSEATQLNKGDFRESVREQIKL
ncbi:MAG TPA: hypothetical protein VFC44_08285 [Candidatus Saccharimonadales bacterium]|jgi:hypothetical protein|nr:hypothetical protein [Candidatus Saccharimonadales bacterium]